MSPPQLSFDASSLRGGVLMCMGGSSQARREMWETVVGHLLENMANDG